MEVKKVEVKKEEVKLSKEELKKKEEMNVLASKSGGISLKERMAAFQKKA